MQPLDVSFMFHMLYRAATMNNSINGFKKNRLFPLNKQAFNEEDFPIHSHRLVSINSPSTSVSNSEVGLDTNGSNMDGG